MTLDLLSLPEKVIEKVVQSISDATTFIRLDACLPGHLRLLTSSSVEAKSPLAFLEMCRRRGIQVRHEGFIFTHLQKSCDPLVVSALDGMPGFDELRRKKDLLDDVVGGRYDPRKHGPAYPEIDYLLECEVVDHLGRLPPRVLDHYMATEVWRDIQTRFLQRHGWLNFMDSIVAADNEDLWRHVSNLEETDEFFRRSSKMYHHMIFDFRVFGRDSRADKSEIFQAAVCDLNFDVAMACLPPGSA